MIHSFMYEIQFCQDQKLFSKKVVLKGFVANEKQICLLEDNFCCSLCF